MTGETVTLHNAILLSPEAKLMWFEKREAAVQALLKHIDAIGNPLDPEDEAGGVGYDWALNVDELARAVLEHGEVTL